MNDSPPRDCRPPLSTEELFSAHIQRRIDGEVDTYLERRKWPLRLFGGLLSIFGVVTISLIGFNLYRLDSIREEVSNTADAVKAELDAARHAKEQLQAAANAAQQSATAAREDLVTQEKIYEQQSREFDFHVKRAQTSRDDFEKQMAEVKRDMDAAKQDVATTLDRVREQEQRAKAAQATVLQLQSTLQDGLVLWSSIRDELVRVSSSVSTSVLRGHAWRLDARENPEEYRPVVVPLPFSEGQYVRVTFNDFKAEKLADGRRKVTAVLYYDIIREPGEERKLANTHMLELSQDDGAVELQDTNHRINVDFAYLPPNHLLFYFPDFVTFSVSVNPQRLDTVFEQFRTRKRTL